MESSPQTRFSLLPVAYYVEAVLPQVHVVVVDARACMAPIGRHELGLRVAVRHVTQNVEAALVLLGGEQMRMELLVPAERLRHMLQDVEGALVGVGVGDGGPCVQF